MPTQHIARRALLVPALGLAVAAVLSACSSSPSSPASNPTVAATTASAAAPSPTPAASSASAPAATGAVATITKNWETFFDGKTPAATKVALVQNGQQFSAFLQAQSKSAQSQTASASVQKVTLTSATQATVDYTILISGTPMLSGQKGTAVLEGGTWKVGLASFCGLAKLQSGGKAVPGCPAG